MTHTPEITALIKAATLEHDDLVSDAVRERLAKALAPFRPAKAKGREIWEWNGYAFSDLASAQTANRGDGTTGTDLPITHYREVMGDE